MCVNRLGSAACAVPGLADSIQVSSLAASPDGALPTQAPAGVLPGGRVSVSAGESVTVLVWVTASVIIGVGVSVRVRVAAGVRVLVRVDVGTIAVNVNVFVRVGVFVLVGVCVFVGVETFVSTDVFVPTGVKEGTLPGVDVDMSVIVAACVELGNGVRVVGSGSNVAVTDAVDDGVGETKGCTGFSPAGSINPTTSAVSKKAPKSTKTIERMTFLEMPVGGNRLRGS